MHFVRTAQILQFHIFTHNVLITHNILNCVQTIWRYHDLPGFFQSFSTALGWIRNQCENPVLFSVFLRHAQIYLICHVLRYIFICKKVITPKPNSLAILLARPSPLKQGFTVHPYLSLSSFVIVFVWKAFVVYYAQHLLRHTCMCRLIYRRKVVIHDKGVLQHSSQSGGGKRRSKLSKI